ncbi:hypothetical protein SprV_0401624600 [Sparganum proliferum]
MSPRVLADTGDKKRRYKEALMNSQKRRQIKSEDPEGPRQRQISLDKRNEDWFRNLQSKPHRHCHNQKGDSHVISSSDLQDQQPTVSNCPCCQQNFRTPIGLVDHLRTQCTNHLTTASATSTNVPDPVPTPTTTSPTLTTVASNLHAPLPLITPTSIISATTTAATKNTVNSTIPITDQNAPDAPLTTNTFTITITNPSSPAMWTQSQSVFIATAHSSHTSAWSATCEFVAQRVANQCLGPPRTVAEFAPTVHAHSLIAWAYLATSTSTKICSISLRA